MKVLSIVMLLCLLAGGALAETVTSSPVPIARPGQTAAPAGGTLIFIPVYYDADIRPKARPGASPVPAPTSSVSEIVPVAARGGIGLSRSAIPEPRPKVRRASSNRSGALCGVRDIVGTTAAPIPGKLRGCGVAKPVRVSEVAGIKLSRASIMDCGTAKALRSWVANGVKPGVGRLGGGVAQINVVADYSCRTINHRPGGEISEHGKGKAIDISGITLRNGKTLSLLRDWRRRAEGDVLKRLHRAACGPFSTVLGPEADRFHQDHFHFDTKRRRNPYCR